MALNIGINGYGRIGRLVLRAAYENPVRFGEVKILAVNDAFGAPKIEAAKFINMVRILTAFDTIHGRFLGLKTAEEALGAVRVSGDILEIRRDTAAGEDSLIDHISVLNQKEIPDWGKLGVDVVIESTGAMRDLAKASEHLKAGAKKVIISAPAKGEDVPTFVLGVNEGTYDPAKHHVVSNASCTTNCLAPVAKVLLEGPGIVSGLMNTIHAYTNDQNLVDGFHKEELRRMRAAGLNQILTKTGAADAVALVLPSLKGKLTGKAIRVPTGNVSIVDLTVITEKPTSVEEVNELLENASVGNLKGILAYINEELVSSDFNHDPRSSIVDAKAAKVLGNTLGVVAYYDNEWGYANRMVDLALYMASQGL